MDQGGDVPVAPELAQQGLGVPQHQVGGVGPGQPGMGGEQRPPFVAEGGALGGAAGQSCGPLHLGGGHGVAQHPGQGGIGRPDPGLEHGGG